MRSAEARALRCGMLQDTRRRHSAIPELGPRDCIGNRRGRLPHQLPMHPLLIIAAVLVGLFVLVCAAVGFGHLTRGTPVSRIHLLDESAPLPVASERFCELVQVIAESTMYRGNRIEVLTN